MKVLFILGIILFIFFNLIPDTFIDLAAIDKEEKNIYDKIKSIIFPPYKTVKTFLLEKGTLIFGTILGINLLINAIKFIY